MARAEMVHGGVGCLLHIFVVLCTVLSFNGCFLSIDFIDAFIYGHLCGTWDIL